MSLFSERGVFAKADMFERGTQGVFVSHLISLLVSEMAHLGLSVGSSARQRRVWRIIFNEFST
jgi:hypothetical protein